MPSRFLSRAASVAGLAGLALGLAGCPTNQSAVCQSIGDCSQGGSSDWVQACQNEANLLQTEAQTDDCASEYNDYYSCAESSFTCTGSTASFPGCDGKLSALDACINAAEAKTSCAALLAAEAVCGTADPSATSDAGHGSEDAAPSTGGDEAGSDAGEAGLPDAGSATDAAAPLPSAGNDAGADGGLSVPIACTAARDCEARCYLDIVADVCAPQVNELDEFATCASACPP